MTADEARKEILDWYCQRCGVACDIIGIVKHECKEKKMLSGMLDQYKSAIVDSLTNPKEHICILSQDKTGKCFVCGKQNKENFDGSR